MVIMTEFLAKMIQGSNKPFNNDAHTVLRFAYGYRHFTLNSTKPVRVLTERYVRKFVNPED